MLLITQNTIFNNISSNVAEAQVKAQKTQQQASSGLRVNDAADDPVASARGSLLGASLATLQSMDRASRIASSNLDASEQAITQSMELLERAQELAVAAANASLSATQRGFIAEEVGVLRDTMVSFANTKNAGVFLFSGFRNVEPFAADGTYSGDDGVRRVDAAPGLRIDVNLPGSTVYNVTGGENVIGTLSDLHQSLMANDVPGATAALTRIQRSADQLSEARTAVSANLAQATAAGRKRADLSTLLQRSRSEAIEIEQTEALVRMTEAQTAYQTAVSSAARIIAQMQTNPLWR